jgi:hypothetical protein
MTSLGTNESRGPDDPVGDRLLVVIPELDHSDTHVSLLTSKG